MDINEKNSIADVLRDMHDKKKNVEILLKNGKTFSGLIHTVGQQLVVIEQIGTKSFFNAVINIEEITALEVQVRTT